MSTTLISKRFLNLKGVNHSTVKVAESVADLYLHGSENVPVEQIAKSIILSDSQSTVMAIIPSAHDIQIDTLNKQLQRKLKLIQQVNLRGYKLHCAPGSLPCLGNAFGFESIIDDSLLKNDFIFFTSGAPGELIKVTTKDFQLLHSQAWYGKTFSAVKQKPHAKLQHELDISKPAVSKIRELVDTVNNLPPMPTMALKIIQLSANPYAHVNDLATLVESDPSLTAQIIRQAQSPLYGYQGQITSIDQAISRVLGYDMVMNVALGISASRPFRNALTGPLGIKEYWRHATYSAAICQTLCNLLPQANRPRAGTAYLCGLLHNFGFLLLGHLFPQELIRLNKSIIANPLASIRSLEHAQIQTDHTEIGSQLMKSWDMPTEITVALEQHHNLDYDGEYAEYSRLVMLTDILLKGHELGDADSNEIPAQLLQQLNISEERLYAVFEKTIQARENLDIMARQMAA